MSKSISKDSIEFPNELVLLLITSTAEFVDFNRSSRTSIVFPAGLGSGVSNVDAPLLRIVFPAGLGSGKSNVDAPLLLRVDEFRRLGSYLGRSGGNGGTTVVAAVSLSERVLRFPKNDLRFREGAVVLEAVNEVVLRFPNSDLGRLRANDGATVAESVSSNDMVLPFPFSANGLRSSAGNGGTTGTEAVSLNEMVLKFPKNVLIFLRDPGFSGCVVGIGIGS
jgi:hypothetical protein